MDDLQVHAKLKLIASAIRARRRELHVSQEGLAALCDVDRRYIGRIENAKSNISFRLQMKIASGLGLSVAELMARAKV